MEPEWGNLGERINAVDFDHPFAIVDGEVVDAPAGVYAPSVYHDDKSDIGIDSDGWTALTGMTGQYGYRGAVMHPSEFIGGGIAQHLVEDFDPGTVFVVVAVGDPDEAASDVGWAILSRSVIGCGCGEPREAGYWVSVVLGREVSGGTETSEVGVYFCAEHLPSNAADVVTDADKADGWAALESSVTHMRFHPRHSAPPGQGCQLCRHIDHNSTVTCLI